jgi:hypothetical protein
MYFSGTSPQYRESEELSRLSPITKKWCFSTFLAGHVGRLWLCSLSRYSSCSSDAVYVNLSAPDLHRFAWQADNAFYIALVGFFRKPENDDVAALKMTPANALRML